MADVDIYFAEGVDHNNPIHKENLRQINAVFDAVNSVVEGYFPSTDFTNASRFYGNTAESRTNFMDNVKNMKVFEVKLINDKYLVKTGSSSVEEASDYIQRLEKVAIAFSRNLDKIKREELKKIGAFQHFKMGFKKLIKRD